MITFLIVMLAFSLVCIGFLLYELWKQQKAEQARAVLGETLADLEAKKGVAEVDITLLKSTKKELDATLSEIQKEIAEAAVQRAAAAERAETDLAREREARRADFERQLDAEFKAFSESHPITQAQLQFSLLDAKIQEATDTLAVLHQQLKIAAEQEDFNAAHSIDLSDKDKNDIVIIRDMVKNLGRKEALYKLIWSEFYQKPLQALCRSLDADKTLGIYKITNMSTGQAYIGQAVDIGARWKEHVKTSLGIGSSANLTNRFYKNMLKVGPENFTFEILEKVENVAALNEREKYWIETLGTMSFGYNSKTGG